MILKQLSVFVENKEGRMKDITQVLKDSNINIQTLSLADTTEYGMLRLIVSDPEQAKAKLREAGFPVSITDVLAVKARDQIGFLHDMLCKLDANITSIEYMYTLPTEDGPVVILKVANPVEVEQVLENI